MEGLTELEREELGEMEVEAEGERELLGEVEAEAELDTDELGERELLGDCDCEELGDNEVEGEREREELADGESELLGERELLGLNELDGLSDKLALALGDSDAEGERLAEGEAEDDVILAVNPGAEPYQPTPGRGPGWPSSYKKILSASSRASLGSRERSIKVITPRFQVLKVSSDGSGKFRRWLLAICRGITSPRLRLNYPARPKD